MQTSVVLRSGTLPLAPTSSPRQPLTVEVAGAVTIRMALSNGIINNPLVFFFFVLYFPNYLQFSIVQKK